MQGEHGSRADAAVHGSAARLLCLPCADLNKHAVQLCDVSEAPSAVVRGQLCMAALLQACLLGCHEGLHTNIPC